MPGLCGILDPGGTIDVGARLDGMLATLRHHDWYWENRYFDRAAGLGVGRMTLGFVNNEPQPVRNEDGSLLAFLHGELYDAERARADLIAAGHRFAGASHAEILLHGFEQHGPEFCRRLHGSFVAVVWNSRTGQLFLTNDRFGLRPLYYARLPGRLLWSSGLKAIALDADVSSAPHWRGSQFFSFGQYLNDDTSLADVHVLPAGAWFEYDTHQERLRAGTYLRPGDVTPAAGESRGSARSQSDWLNDLDAAFQQAVDRRQQGTAQLGLALSGGLDARMILGSLDHQRQKIQTVSYGIEGSLDHRCAARLAELVGSRHVNYVLDADFLANFRQHLANMVRLTDGQYLSQCIILPTLPLYRRLGIEVLLRGHAGELMHMHKAYAYSIDDAALAIRDDAGLQAWLMAHLQGYMLAAVDRPLFRQLPPRELERLARESLNDALAPAQHVDPPVQRIWRLFVSQRLRRETSLSLAKFGSVVEVRVPYLDNDLVQLLLSAPPELKLGETIQAHILRKRRPDFLEVVNSNTGTRIGASRTMRKFSTFKLRVLAKLGVPGYQPYERLGLWLRRELSPLVDEVLLGERCLDRGIFEPDTVRRIVAQHRAREKNHTYLIMAMMIYELGRRELFGDLASLVSPDQPLQVQPAPVGR